MPTFSCINSECPIETLKTTPLQKCPACGYITLQHEEEYQELSTTPKLRSLSMNENNASTMPYLWSMNQLERYHDNRGYHFFKPSSKRFFRSRIQTLPPYKGRVFVTSEQFSHSSPRLYSVRCIEPDGNISTIGMFQGHKTSYFAHTAAKAYALEKFDRSGNESIEI